MREEIHDVIVWGQVIIQGERFLLLSPAPYHSEMEDRKIGRSVWQPEGTLKWEVAPVIYRPVRNENDDYYTVYDRSIIVFDSSALIEFYQNPKTVKVNYVIIEEGDDNDDTANAGN